MPGMDGYQTTAALRAEGEGRRLPIIALTAQTMPGDRERCFAAGMNGYVAKPFHREDLASEIERVLGAFSPAPPPASAHRSTLPSAGESPLLAPGAIQRVLGIRGKGLAVATELVKVFSTDSVRILTGMRAAISARDGEAFGRLAHELKGSSGMIGAMRVSAMAHAIKQAAADFDPVAIEGDLDHLEAAVAETQQALTRTLTPPDSA